MAANSSTGHPSPPQEWNITGFILDADKGKLQELCDRYLNAPLGGGRRFVPAGGFVLLACCNLASLRSTTPPYNNFGNFVEHEVAFWVMVIDKSRERLYWFIPYIFIDNTYAMAMGRELYGFPKSIGTISLPALPAQAEHFSLDTLVVKKYPPLAKGEIKRLVEVRKAVAGAYSGPVGSWPDLGGLVRKVVGFLDDELNLFADIRLVIHSMDDLLHLRDTPVVPEADSRCCRSRQSRLSGDCRNDVGRFPSASNQPSGLKLRHRHRSMRQPSPPAGLRDACGGNPAVEDQLLCQF